MPAAPPAANLLSVVIPAYNEERNIAPVFQAVRAALPAAQPVEVLF